MQAEITIQLQEPLILPINYNHILQAVIYRALSTMPSYSAFLHDVGFQLNDKQFRIFTFSQLKGQYKIFERHIIFQDIVSFEIRSPDPLLIYVVTHYFDYYGVEFGKITYRDISITKYDYTVEEEHIHISMISPMTIYSKDSETGYTHFYSPFDKEFYEKLVLNFEHKYQAYYQVYPIGNLEIHPYGNKEPKKLVTRYKSSMINAWYGQYELIGDRKYLDFLYQIGLGGKNAQGFGMFQIY